MGPSGYFGCTSKQNCTNNSMIRLARASSRRRGSVCTRGSSNKFRSSPSVEKITIRDTPASSIKKRKKLVKLVTIHFDGKGRLLVSVALVICCTVAASGPLHFRLFRDDSAASLVSANEMFDEANEAPAGGGGDGFNDDDDDDDGAMDSSASNDYPDTEGGSEAEDADDDPDGGESRQGRGSWLLPGAQATAQSRNRGKRRVWCAGPADRVAWRRPIAVAASRRHHRRDMKAAPSLGPARDEEEFRVDDGDEDAWVHDGVDDIQIDPETKQAASELSREEQSIDAEYEPHQDNEEDVILVNGTRLTTIAEVIPMRSPSRRRQAAGSDHEIDREEPTRISARFASPAQFGSSLYLPAAYLSMDQVVSLVDSRAGKGAQARRRNGADE